VAPDNTGAVEQSEFVADLVLGLKVIILGRGGAIFRVL
jgi:hypothetical protein